MNEIRTNTSKTLLDVQGLWKLYRSRINLKKICERSEIIIRESGVWDTNKINKKKQDNSDYNVNC